MLSLLFRKFNCKFMFFFQEGETVLISAARDGHLEVVRTLLSKYADVEAADTVSSLKWKFPMLHCRCYHFLLQSPVTTMESF